MIKIDKDYLVYTYLLIAYFIVLPCMYKSFTANTEKEIMAYSDKALWIGLTSTVLLFLYVLAIDKGVM